MDLSEFLDRERPAVKAAIHEIQGLIQEVVNMLVEQFLEQERTWPYQLIDGQAVKRPKEVSFSTTAMIVFALGLAARQIHQSSQVPAVRYLPSDDDDGGKELRRSVVGLIDKALDGLMQESLRLREASGSASVPDIRPLTRSSTFGQDDPLTLSWLVELPWMAEDADRKSSRGPTKQKDRNAYLELLRARGWEVVSRVLGPGDPMSQVLKIEENERVPHSFPLLKVLQLGDALSRGRRPLSQMEGVSRVHERLLERIHIHLSESGIRDGQFDAPDLVFSLEGWLLSSPVEPNLDVVDRVLDVLSQTQERTPYWRALRPFKVTERGLALLPQSVEVANSLLRICNSRWLISRNYFSTHRALLERYSRWLMGRTFRGYVEEKRFVGWESDHTYTLNSIHLWQTSQALIFLQHYAAMLQQHLAQTSLRLAGLRVREPKTANWSDKREPLRGMGSDDGAYRVYQRIGIEFIQGRRAQQTLPADAPPAPTGGDQQRASSMLLYGPPGTGKSTIADKVADALNFRLITVTPGDFIAGDGEGVEARAKAIFDVLQEQSDLVVLFDEVDRLLLDRDSGLYRKQGDVFQLLTPSMLTKFAELSKLRRIILIVATNYYEQIDRAIKRPGRIDARYLVLPPNRKQRVYWLGEEFADREWADLSDEKKKTTPRESFRSKWMTIPAGTVDEIGRKTVRFTYRELIDLVGDVRRRHPNLGGKELGAKINETVGKRSPLIALEGYGVRLGYKTARGGAEQVGADTVELPLEEFALLAYLELDATGSLPARPIWLRSALRAALDADCVADPKIARDLRGQRGKTLAPGKGQPKSR